MVGTALRDKGSMFKRTLEEDSVAVDVRDRKEIMEKVESWIRGSLIGAGAFGKVNLAMNRENGELFAVKSIECDERMTSEMQAMENEVQILQSLESPFIVKFLGSSFSVENGKSMRNVFMEYMSGGSVVDLMKKFGGHFEEPLVRNYTRSILEAIRYLHSQDIVHCDIKGRNLLVGSSGAVKLADFGGARRLDGEPTVLVDSDLLKVKGTPLWMAPEVAQQTEQGPASDIWSLGCTVIEMATGKAPWSDIATAHNPFVALFHIGCTDEVPELPSCLSWQGQDFLKKCFQRDPRLRWTAEQLLQHPFITDNFFTIQSSKPAETSALPSPSSAFDFPSSSSASFTSSIGNSVPILKAPRFAKRFSPQQQQQASNFFHSEEALLKVKETTTPTSSATGFRCNSPLSDLPGAWIVVRSPKPVSPLESLPTVSPSAGELKPSILEDEAAFQTALKIWSHPALKLRRDTPATASCSSLENGICIMEGDGQSEREVRGETSATASCPSMENVIGIMDGDYRIGREQLTTEQTSCSTAQFSSFSRKTKLEDDERLCREEVWDLRRRADCLSSSSSESGKKKFRRSQPEADDLEKFCSPAAAVANAEDARCITSGRSNWKPASCPSPRRLASWRTARRNMILDIPSLFTNGGSALFESEM